MLTYTMCPAQTDWLEIFHGRAGWVIFFRGLIIKRRSSRELSGCYCDLHLACNANGLCWWQLLLLCPVVTERREQNTRDNDTWESLPCTENKVRGDRGGHSILTSGGCSSCMCMCAFVCLFLWPCVCAQPVFKKWKIKGPHTIKTKGYLRPQAGCVFMVHTSLSLQNLLIYCLTFKNIFCDKTTHYPIHKRN